MKKKVTPITLVGEHQVKRLIERYSQDEPKVVGRKYLPSFASLMDSLHLVQMKMNYGGEYMEEMRDILHDIDLLIEGGIKINADMLRAIVAMTQANVEIWIGEDNQREGVKEGENVDWEKMYKLLLRTHKLNGTRAFCNSRIQELAGGRTNKKLNYHDPEWKINW